LYPHAEIIEKGPTGTSVRLHNGRQVDLRVQKPELYGAMLQYFTGSKNHNIALRSYGLSKGLSLNEYGIKHVKTGKVKEYSNEIDFYGALGLSYIEPELREDRGEIQASLSGMLPKLIQHKNIVGDLHVHTNYDLKPSHDLGQNPFSDYLTKAENLGYEYIGISDHNPSIGNHNEKEIVSIMKGRKEYYEQQYSSYTKDVQKISSPHASRQVHYFLMCEVDILPNGDLALPFAALEYVDAVIVSIHSAFTQERSVITKRIVRALTSHPKVRVFGHPTGRLLGKREGVDADWKEVFAICKKLDIALEINAYPDRLDLPDMLVYEAVKNKNTFVIDTDAHAVDHMNLMKYGVSVARRGWAQNSDIVNTLEYTEFRKWLIND
jgi:DNA polymerase (family X)